MYIRRKVFSVALDEYGEERYFSTNEIINEDDYLDEMLYSDAEEKLFTEFVFDGTRHAVEGSSLARNARKAGMSQADFVRFLRENPEEFKKIYGNHHITRTGEERMVNASKRYMNSLSNDPKKAKQMMREMQEAENRGLAEQYNRLKSKLRGQREFEGKAAKGSAFFGKDAAAILDANEAKPVRRIGQQAGAKRGIKNLMTARNAKIAGGVGAGALAAGGLYYGAKKYKESHNK